MPTSTSGESVPTSTVPPACWIRSGVCASMHAAVTQPGSRGSAALSAVAATSAARLHGGSSGSPGSEASSVVRKSVVNNVEVTVRLPRPWSAGTSA